MLSQQQPVLHETTESKDIGHSLQFRLQPRICRRCNLLTAQLASSDDGSTRLSLSASASAVSTLTCIWTIRSSLPPSASAWKWLTPDDCRPRTGFRSAWPPHLGRLFWAVSHAPSKRCCFTGELERGLSSSDNIPKTLLVARQQPPEVWSLSSLP